jgi:class 3 adenylate cyclase
MTEASAPTGTVTFLFTDIEGSTRLWDQHPDSMSKATDSAATVFTVTLPITQTIN